MTVQTQQTLEVKRVIRAPRERVYQAWTDPAEARQWACPYPEGLVSYESDVRVGGSYRIRMRDDDRSYTAFGTYREVDPGRRLVYTWDWEEEENRVGETVVTVEFLEVDDGTEVRVTHTGFAGAEDRDGHREGWDACLRNLADTLA